MHTWISITREGIPFTLTLSEEAIQWQDSDEHTLSSMDFFKKYNPFYELPLTEQNRLMHELSMNLIFKNDPGQYIYAIISFWKNFPALQIEEKTYTFQTRISNVSEWKLELSKHGLIWHDLSKHYSETKKFTEQTLADFWFYGPVFPLPSLDMRTEIVSIIKNAIMEIQYSFPELHFPLIQYPTFVMGPQWVDGDHIASNFVIMREYGIEDGRENFHDGLVFLTFTSFEHCLTRHDIPEYNLSKEILNEIREMIAEANPGMYLYPI